MSNPCLQVARADRLFAPYGQVTLKMGFTLE